MTILTVGRLATKAGVNLATIRYYERRGLLPAPPRNNSGYRSYSEDSVRRLRFIRHAQELGFTLKEVGELLGMTAKKRPSAEVCDLARNKISDIENRIRLLRSLKKRLESLTTACDRKGTVDDCVIIRELYA
jgi:MerR family transcriptional regulator, copper efflux regulator